MNEQELKHRAALEVLPECVRILMNEHLKNNSIDEYSTKKMAYRAAMMAADIADDLISEFEHIEYKKLRAKEYRRDVLNHPVEWFVRNKKAVDALEQAGLKTVADLVQCKRKDLLSIKHIGGRAIIDIDNYIEQYDLYIGMDISKLEEQQ